MTRQKLQKIRELMKQAGFSGIEEACGVRITIGNGRYSDSNAHLKLEIADVTADGTVLTKEAEDFKAYAWRYAMEPSDLGREFRHDNEVYEIIGLKPRSKKYPILGRNSRDKDKVLKFPGMYVKRNLLPVEAAAPSLT